MSWGAGVPFLNVCPQMGMLRGAEAKTAGKGAPYWPCRGAGLTTATCRRAFAQDMTTPRLT